MRKCLNRIDEVEPRVRSFVPGVAMAESRKQALHRAAALDARLAEESDASSSSGELPLAGVTLAIKDNMCTEGIPTTAGSRALAGYVPPHDATVVRRLLDAGATVVGKTMCDEFGMGSTTESCYVQGSDDDLATGDGSLPPPGPTTRNPWDLTRVPGGSSGGSAAAVASGCCDAALGTDTGGSVRQPAAFCGVVGLKPTYGLCSRWGLIAYASSLDVPGPIAATVEDCALLLDVIAGPDARDASAAPSPSPSAGTGWAGGSGAASYAGAVDAAQALLDSPGAGGALAGLRVGVVSQTMDAGSGGVDPGVHATVEAALDRLKGAGAQVGPANLPSFGLGLPAYYVTAVAEASSNLSRYDGLRYANAGASASGFGGADLMAAIADHRGRGLGGEPLRRVLMGTYALSEGYGASLYKRAQAVRKRVQGEMLGALDDFDVLVTPTAPTLAYASDAKDLLDPLQVSVPHPPKRANTILRSQTHTFTHTRTCSHAHMLTHTLFLPPSISLPSCRCTWAMS